MASRENQGYLVAVILLSLLVIGLGVTTYIGMSQSAEFRSQNQQYVAKLNSEERAKSAHVAQAAMLRAYIGNMGIAIADEPSWQRQLNEIGVEQVVEETRGLRQEYDRAMQRFGAAAVDEVNRTYWGMADRMVEVLHRKHLEVAELNNQIKTIESDARTRMAEAAARVEELQQDLDKAVADLERERRDARTKATELERQLVEVTASLTRRTREAEDLRRERDEIRRQWEEEVARLNDQVVALKAQVDALTRESYEVPDGEIIQINPVRGVVYINRGSADALRVRQTFSVFDRSVTNFETGRQKAKIEVTAIRGPHSAEARITEDNHLDPIMMGDLILSPVWQPGYPVPIALAGFFDLDGDGRSDVHRLIHMIEQSGGVVAAHNDEEGRVHGRIDTNTRYLVIDDPTDEQLSRIHSGIAELETQAEAHGVQRISLRRLIEWMGASGTTQVETGRRTHVVPPTDRIPDNNGSNGSNYRPNR